MLGFLLEKVTRIGGHAGFALWAQIDVANGGRKALRNSSTQGA
jgi:hypothetical protein